MSYSTTLFGKIKEEFIYPIPLYPPSPEEGKGEEKERGA